MAIEYHKYYIETSTDSELYGTTRHLYDFMLGVSRLDNGHPPWTGYNSTASSQAHRDGVRILHISKGREQPEVQHREPLYRSPRSDAGGINF